MVKMTFFSRSTPAMAGYHDTVLVDDNGNAAEFDCSCCPNPIKPSNGTPWEKVYGWLAPGTYQARVVSHPKHGKCILLAGGAELPARRPNVNHDDRRVVSEVFFHSGESETWRGSAGCLTAPPVTFGLIMSKLAVGDAVQVSVEDKHIIDGGY